MKFTIQQTLAGAILAVSCMAAIGAEEPAIVTVKSVNIRARPSLIGEVLGQLKEGDSVTILEEIVDKTPPAGAPSKWARIKLPEGISVWLFAEYVHPTDKTITVNRINLRAGPSESYGIIGRLDRGTAVQEVKSVEGWMAIAAPAGAYAFVAAEYLKSTAPAPAAPASPTPAVATPPVATTTPAVTSPPEAPGSGASAAASAPASGVSATTAPTPAPGTAGSQTPAASVTLPGASPVTGNTTPTAPAEMVVVRANPTTEPSAPVAPGLSTPPPASAASSETPATTTVSTPSLPLPAPTTSVTETPNVAAPAAAAATRVSSAVVAAASTGAGAVPAAVPSAPVSAGSGVPVGSAGPLVPPSGAVTSSSSGSALPLLAPPRATSSARPTDVRPAETNTPASTATSVSEEARPKRRVQREGIVGPVFNVQAPTYFELISPDSRKVIDYLYVSDPTMNLRPFWGKRIIVTGVEGIDPRWPKTPLIEVESVEALP